MTRLGPVLFASIIVAAAMASAPVAAQQFPVELHGYAGAALPRGDWNESDAIGTGWGYGANVVVRLHALIGVYGGWDKFSFNLDEAGSTEEGDVSINDTGLRAGIELSLPLPFVSPFIGGGIFFGQSEVELSDSNSTLRLKTDSKLGFEAGAGLDIALGPVGVRPRIAYREHDSDFSGILDAFGEDRTTIEHLNLTIGVSLIP